MVYVSPNRSHHFKYAEGLHAQHLLTTYVQGFPRFKGSPKELSRSLICYRDHLQLIYIALFKLDFTGTLSNKINFQSKNWIDKGFTKAMEQADIGLFYNGCGLKTIQHWKTSPKLFVCEAVNSHVETQTSLLREEANRTKIEFEEPFEPEYQKRIQEYNESDYILCPSKFVADSFVEHGIPSQRILINRFGVSLPPNSPVERSTKKHSEFRILYVGSINYRKGVRYLIEAFEKLNVANKKLWIVGPELKPSGLEDISIPEGVVFKGVLKGDDLKDAYTQADVFVQPSIEEGLSLVIGEALGHGLPVIATYNTGALEFFDDGTCGFHIPIRDPQAICDRITELVDQPEKLQKFSEAAIKLSRNFGGWLESQTSLSKTLERLPLKS